MCRSGRTGRSRKPLYRKVSEVRILPSPPSMKIFKKKQIPTDEITTEELAARVQKLEKQLKTMQRAITKIGIVRFNPFKEIGGDQSFSIALLDEQRNGVLITSYYGRELNRIYAKPIQGGASDHELSVEEKEAVNQAIGLENPKSK